ncbi:galactokinase [Robiginitalea sp. M366]|uniref:galactokinase n=1 Tax=Robiginitalea aestuariiviva TaxID=3036903 RepID=UPI00240DAD63|nr:galactokinase [Robiginitalea aestuariiviva]MDG1573278.1 galactokinase [Robiginitalea aestuariiviva]
METTNTPDAGKQSGLELASSTRDAFRETFGSEPLMVFSPGRINLIGEHVDYNEGVVFPAAVDQGIYVALGLASSGKDCHAITRNFGEEFRFKPSGLKALPDGGWRNYVIGVVAELEKRGHPVAPFNLMIAGNLPQGGGMSSSAALENGIVYGLNTLFTLGLDRMDMVRVSLDAEHHYAGVQCGIMDQYASMFGVKDHFLLLDCRTLEAEAVQIDLQGHELFLINTRVQHSLASSTYNERRALCDRTAAALGVPALRDASLEALKALQREGRLSAEEFAKVSYVLEEMARTQAAAQAIRNQDLQALGALLFASHQGLAQKYEVSCPELDFLVEQARQAPGVLGARMMGAGFGGCTLNLVRCDASEAFTRHTREAYRNAFGHDCDILRVHLGRGTHVVESEAGYALV